MNNKNKKVRNVLAIIFFLFLAAVIIVPITIEVTKTRPEPDDVTTLVNRIECFPLISSSITEEFCTDAGCLWDGTDGTVDLSVDNAPKCYLNTDEYGYEVNGPTENTERGFTVNLRRRRLVGEKLPQSLYGGDVDEVTFEVNYYSDNSLGFALYPKDTDRYGYRPPVNINVTDDSINNRLYRVELITQNIGQPFNFKILRQSSNAVIFDTSMGGLTIAEQFLMISTKLPTNYTYGFGENTHDSFLHDMNYRMWPIFTRDIAPDEDDVNLYGAHPFYMASEVDGSSHGVFFFNSHSIDVTTMPNPGLTLRAIGGILEFFVFMGPTPESVVMQYSDVIGKTFMPPYFALGFQLSRWGYKNTDDIRQVISRTKDVEIPHDIQYADIDYMDGRRDFTIDLTNFGDLPQLVDEVKKEGLRFIVILDPAIANDYDTFLSGQTANVFVEWANSTIKPSDQPTDSNIILGNVWPENRTAFPDFFKESTKIWWSDEIKGFYEKLKFDGLWIDMNEVSNFDTNEYSDKLQCPTNKWDDPPYKTMAATIGPINRLSDKTICMVTNFGENGQYLHYEIHNLYGYSQAEITQNAVRSVTGKRSLVLSRSTFAGIGKFASHWLGDNFSKWSAMANSIIGMLEFNIFGMPYVGADICGFIGNTTEEMCERWMELGAFYPFSRNHNTESALDQDPAQWPLTVAASGRKALNIRYRLLPYLYTLFYESHTTGSTVVRPLYHEYPKDLRARTIDKQFLWGPAFMVSPVVEEGKITVDVYFPDDVWYDYYTGARMNVLGNSTLDAPRDYINLHLRGGYILPAQKPALNTMLSRQNNFELLVSLKNNKASGKLFWDDGESIDTIGSGLFQINRYEFVDNTLRMKSEKGFAWTDEIGPKLDLIQIMGWETLPGNITMKLTDGTEVLVGDFTYVESTKRLTLQCDLDMNTDWEINFK